MMRNPFCKSPVETGTRKAEEYRLLERLFLDTGRSILIEQGFNELNLDRVAEATGWSKGTVHNHFKTKEDIHPDEHQLHLRQSCSCYCCCCCCCCCCC